MLSKFLNYIDYSPSYKKILYEIFHLSEKTPRKTNLINNFKIAKILNNPQNNYDTIHIAGTNGKGSVSTKLASILNHSGFKVGLFTSPHVISFRERFMINDKLITKKEVLKEYNKVNKIIQKEKINFTFFDLITTMAFDYFSQKKIDVGIIEVGIGGGLDSTNIITPKLSVITSIGYDHMNFLGNTLEEISKCKAGIIKQKVPCVIGYDIPPKKVFYNRAHKLDSPIYEVENKGITYDEENSNTVKLAIKILRKYYPKKYGKINYDDVLYGIKKKPMCRMENIFDELPYLKKKFNGKINKIILDVGHNPHGFNKLFQSIKKENGNKKIRVACAFSYGKNVNSLLQILIKNNVQVNFLRSNHGRVINYDKLLDKIKEYPKNIFLDLQNPKKFNGNLAKIVDDCKDGETLIICGTFFIMKDVRKFFGFKDVEDPDNLNEDVMPYIMDYGKNKL